MKRLSIDYLDSELSSRLSAAESSPLAIFDIDSTIMNTAPRNMKILTEISGDVPELSSVVAEISEDEIGWNVVRPLKERIKLSSELEARVTDFWKQRFFTDDYVVYDSPYPGARELIFRLLGKGIGIVYLTGRDQPNMSAGTLRSLKEHGFPVGKGTRFIFKPDFDEPDLDFKLRAMREIKESGDVVLAVENEPGNANIIKRSCPNALVLLINTITSPSPEEPDEGILRFDLYPEI